MTFILHVLSLQKTFFIFFDTYYIARIRPSVPYQ